jgi:hypothetical protein
MCDRATCDGPETGLLAASKHLEEVGRRDCAEEASRKHVSEEIRRQAEADGSGEIL